jgi:hypothetical protein
VGDLQNTGLVQLPDKRFLTTQEFDDALNQITGGDPSAPSRDWFLNVMRGDPSWWEETRGAFEGLGLNPAARGEGFAAGGLVANSPTGDFDPARIDAIVGDLHALNAQ